MASSYSVMFDKCGANHHVKKVTGPEQIWVRLGASAPAGLQESCSDAWPLME